MLCILLNFNTEPVDDYHLPFEEELGRVPTLDQMQIYVVDKKLRPKFSDNFQLDAVRLSFNYY